MPTTKRIYIYKDSHLPENGWFQGCFRCGTITARIFLFTTFNSNNYLYEFIIYTCPDCKKKLHNDTLLSINYNNTCSEYIKREYTELFTS